MSEKISVLIPEEELKEKIAEMGEMISKEYEGKEIPPKEKLAEMVKKQYIKQRRKEMFCEKVGHNWKESNPDPESGTSDLDCQSCGEHQTIQWL